jgi:hypothetical protein
LVNQEVVCQSICWAVLNFWMTGWASPWSMEQVSYCMILGEHKSALHCPVTSIL